MGKGRNMTLERSLRPDTVDEMFGDTGFADGDEGGLMAPAEVAALFHVDPNTVARWSERGKLRALRTPGGHRRYYAHEVLRLARAGMR